jgi:predicted amidohydrolase
MLICYDMVFPESARCLALGGADIIFHPTLGGAAIGDDPVVRATRRIRCTFAGPCQDVSAENRTSTR